MTLATGIVLQVLILGFCRVCFLSSLSCGHNNYVLNFKSSLPDNEQKKSITNKKHANE